MALCIDLESKSQSDENDFNVSVKITIFNVCMLFKIILMFLISTFYIYIKMPKTCCTGYFILAFVDSHRLTNERYMDICFSSVRRRMKSKPCALFWWNGVSRFNLFIGMVFNFP